MKFWNFAWGGTEIFYPPKYFLSIVQHCSDRCSPKLMLWIMRATSQMFVTSFNSFPYLINNNIRMFWSHGLTCRYNEDCLFYSGVEWRVKWGEAMWKYYSDCPQNMMILDQVLKWSQNANLLLCTLLVNFSPRQILTYLKCQVFKLVVFCGWFSCSNCSIKFWFLILFLFSLRSKWRISSQNGNSCVPRANHWSLATPKQRAFILE